MDDGVECDAHNGTACAASGKDDTVGQSTPAEEVLRRGNGNGLDKNVSLSNRNEH
jgi:hypothetical protein